MYLQDCLVALLGPHAFGQKFAFNLILRQILCFNNSPSLSVKFSNANRLSLGLRLCCVSAVTDPQVCCVCSFSTWRKTTIAPIGTGRSCSLKGFAAAQM